MPTATIAIADAKRTHRSKVTNGSQLLPGVDGRSLWARRCRDILHAHLADLGGDDAVTEAERSILRRAAVLTTELERIEVSFATGEGASGDDLDRYQRAAGSLRRMLEAVGLERRAKNITPPIAEYLRAKGAAA